MKDMRRYVIIAPVRDEEKYLPKTIDSMVSQTIKPTEFVIVDDGSKDRTPEIIKEASKIHPWIHYVKRPDRGERKVGGGVIEAFYDGFRNLNTKEYDYIGKIDGDLSFGQRYFENLFEKFDTDPYLGAASGKLFLKLDNGKIVEERIGDETVLGGMQFYRKKTFDDAGGFVREVMWDGIVYHRCRMAGWRTRSFKDKELMIFDHRQMGSSHKSIYHGRMRWGWGQYFMGTHPLYIFAIGGYRMFERPYILGGLLIILGYLKGWHKKSKRYEYPGFRKSLHAWQMERLKIGKRLEKIP
ncbi:MAG: glycosyltransferase [Desulfobacterales bacterium]|nr:glycosyltransferase [Desulfobacterales bacterium]MBF0395573.1 glycosyltransferase [Desulfobacterales bacterium]